MKRNDTLRSMMLRAVMIAMPVLAALPAGARKYTNPLRTTAGELLRVADPCVYDDGRGTYYLSASEEGGFSYYTSRDLVTWERGGWLLRVPDDEPVRTCLWASEVREHGGTYYMTYSGFSPQLNRLCICLAVSGRPEGPFRIVHSPWLTLERNGCIDASLFWDTDGTPYVYFSENGADPRTGTGFGALRMARLRRDMEGLDGPVLHVNDDMSAPWEQRMATPGTSCNEAPTVFLHRGTYYMTYSANETHNGHYAMGVQTAPTPLGPWTKAPYNPIATTAYGSPRRSPGGLPEVSSPGHNGVVVGPKGRHMYLIYHRHAPEVSTFPSNERVTCIDRFRIDRRGRLRFDGPSVTPRKKPR